MACGYLLTQHSLEGRILRLSLKNPESSKSGNSRRKPSSICPLQISKCSPVCCRPASPNFTHLLVCLAPNIWLSVPGINEQGNLFSSKGAADEMLQGVIRLQRSSLGGCSRSRGKLLAVHPPLRLVLHRVLVRTLGFQRELSSAPTPQLWQNSWKSGPEDDKLTPGIVGPHGHPWGRSWLGTCSGDEECSLGYQTRSQEM